MKKKIVTIILMCITLLFISACGKNSNPETEKTIKANLQKINKGKTTENYLTPAPTLTRTTQKKHLTCSFTEHIHTRSCFSISHNFQEDMSGTTYCDSCGKNVNVTTVTCTICGGSYTSICEHLTITKQLYCNGFSCGLTEHIHDETCYEIIMEGVKK